MTTLFLFVPVTGRCAVCGRPIRAGAIGPVCQEHRQIAAGQMTMTAAKVIVKWQQMLDAQYRGGKIDEARCGWNRNGLLTTYPDEKGRGIMAAQNISHPTTSGNESKEGGAR